MILAPQDINQIRMYTSLADMLPPKSMVPLLDAMIRKIKERRQDLFDSSGKSHTGRPAYMFETLLKIYIYGCRNRINSSRRLEQETHRNIELIVLTGNLRPDHKTISDFRVKYGKEIKEIVRELRLLLKEVELIGSQRVTIDGTKVKANACKDMLSVSDMEDYLSAMETEMDSYLDSIAREDEEETSEKKQLEEHKAKVKEMGEEIEDLRKQLAELRKRKQNYLSLTDEDCRKMKSRYGNIPGYNVQFGTDSANKFIVYDRVSKEGNDLNELEPAVETIREELGTRYEEISADAGYSNMDAIEKVEKEGSKCFISHPKEQCKTEGLEFIYDEENDKYICPQGKELRKIRSAKKSKQSLVSDYFCKDCTACPIRDKCTTSKRGRTISRYHNQVFRDQRRKEMTESHSLERIKKRKGEIEHINAILKLWLGKTPLVTRGKEKVETEIDIFVISYNINHLFNMLTKSEIITRLGLKIKINCSYFHFLYHSYMLSAIMFNWSVKLLLQKIIFIMFDCGISPQRAIIK